STRLRARLWPCTVGGANSAISSASSSAATNASGTRRCTSPTAAASSASSVRAASRRSRAAPWPTSAARRCTLGGLRKTPRRAAGGGNVALNAATRRAHATASCMPAPIAGPLQGAATRGAGWAEEAVERGPERVGSARLGGVGGVGGQVGAGAERLVARARDDDGAQVPGGLEVAEELHAQVGVEGVPALGPVDGRDPDTITDLPP